MKKTIIRFGIVFLLIFICFVVAMNFVRGTDILGTQNSQGENKSNSQPNEIKSQQQASYIFNQSDDETLFPKLVSFSPYYLQQLINENRIKWTAHHILEYLDLTPIWKSAGIKFPAGYSTFFDLCEGDGNANIFQVNLDDRPDQEVMLKLTKPFEECRYLIFKKTPALPDKKSRWLLLGYIDHEFNRYEMASHRVINVGNKHFLVIRGQTGSGSGYSSYADTWYEVNEKGMRDILSYPSSVGVYPYPDGLSKILITKIPQYQVGQKPRSVTVDFFKSYKAINSSGKETPLLFSKKQTIFFTWDSQATQFVFDAAKSGISNDEFESIYYCGLDSFDNCESNEKFLKHNLKPLLLIARGSHYESKKWLSQFLANCQGTSEKYLLLKALSKW